MPVTIDATVGGASANSFVTEVEQIAYVNERLNLGDWSTVSGTTLSDDENKALVEATREITRQSYRGLRADSTQALDWPRQLIRDPDSPNNDYFSTTAIPQRIKDATSELALQFIKAGTTDIAEIEATFGVKSETIDVISTEYETYLRKRGLERYPRVWRWIAPLLTNASSITSPLIKG